MIKNGLAATSVSPGPYVARSTVVPTWWQPFCGVADATVAAAVPEGAAVAAGTAAVGTAAAARTGTPGTFVEEAGWRWPAIAKADSSRGAAAAAVAASADSTLQAVDSAVATATTVVVATGSTKAGSTVVGPPFERCFGWPERTRPCRPSQKCPRQRWLRRLRQPERPTVRERCTTMTTRTRAYSAAVVGVSAVVERCYRPKAAADRKRKEDYPWDHCTRTAEPLGRAAAAAVVGELRTAVAAAAVGEDRSTDGTGTKPDPT